MFKHNQIRVVVSFPQISHKMELQSILTLSGLSPDDNGRELTCSAENIVGQTEASVLLNILCKNSHCVVWICFALLWQNEPQVTVHSSPLWQKALSSNGGPWPVVDKVHKSCTCFKDTLMKYYSILTYL